MKKTLIIGIAIIALWLGVIILTPFEANLMQQELSWMWKLNIKEAIIFTFGLLIGAIT